MSTPNTLRVAEVVEGQVVRFSVGQTTMYFGRGDNEQYEYFPLNTVLEGVVVLKTDTQAFPNETCLSTPDGNFWFNDHVEVEIAERRADADEVESLGIEIFGTDTWKQLK